MKMAGLIVLAGLALAQAAFAAPPEYVAMQAGCPMIMDGILDEPAWQKAQPAAISFFNGTSPARRR